MRNQLHPGTVWKHRKSGHLYVVVGFIQIESTWKRGVKYLRLNPTGVVVGEVSRDMDEFLDGRFERVEVREC